MSLVYTTNVDAYFMERLDNNCFTYLYCRDTGHSISWKFVANEVLIIKLTGGESARY